MKPIGRKICKNQIGAATIEAVVSFTGFLFVIFTILNIVNFCRAQMLISNAVDTVTKELTQYSYFYQISGLQKFDQDIQAIGEEGAMNLNTVAGSVGDLYSSMGQAIETTEEEAKALANSLAEGSITSESVNTALNTVQADGTNVLTSIEQMEAQFLDVANNPVLYLKSIVAVAGSEGLELVKSHAIAAPLAKALMIKHFGGNLDEANAKLESLGVVGGLSKMNFGMSTIFTKDHPDEIHIVVYYKLKVMQLFEWADFEATICKESRARAWLGGDDVIDKAVAPSGDDGDGEGEDTPEITETEEDEEGSEEETPTAEQIKAQMIEKYGQDIVDAVSAEVDTGSWTTDDWEYQIWLYQNSETIEEHVTDDSITGEEARNIMLLIYPSDTEMIMQISITNDTDEWTVDEWLTAIWLYQYMAANQPPEDSQEEIITESTEESSAISEEDRSRLDSWTYTPSDELYLKYKDVYDDPTYYDQATGSVHWPPDDGFAEGTRKDNQTVGQGKIFKRIGAETGEFLGNATDSFDARALAPHSDPELTSTPVHYYRLTEDLSMTTGKVAPWFGFAGGGEQFVAYKDDNTKYSIQELLDAGILEDITDQVEKGEITVD